MTCLVCRVKITKFTCSRSDDKILQSYPGRIPGYDEVGRLISSLRDGDGANEVTILFKSLEQYIGRVLDRDAIQ